MRMRRIVIMPLVGWYLMTPPIGAGLKPQLGAPLYRWDQTGVPARDSDGPDDPFLTLVECEARKTALKQSNLDEAKKESDASAKMLFLRLSESVGDGRCVRSDDPRLDDPRDRELLKKLLHGN